MPRPRRPSAASPRECPAVLRRLIQSAKTECPAGHADALQASVAFALRKVPVRGIFEPGEREETDFSNFLDSIAREHLYANWAHGKWRKALTAANLPLDKRDPIETAATHIQIQSDIAAYYCGLAFGLVFMCFHDSQ